MKILSLLSISLLLLASPAFAKDVQYNLRVDGMTCPFCAATSEKTLRKMKGVRQVSANLDTGIIVVCADETAELPDAKLSKILKKRGFTYVSKTRQDTCTLDVAAKSADAGHKKPGFWASLFHKHN